MDRSSINNLQHDIPSRMIGFRTLFILNFPKSHKQNQFRHLKLINVLFKFSSSHSNLLKFTFPLFTKPCFTASLCASPISPSICTVHRFEYSTALEIIISGAKTLPNIRNIELMVIIYPAPIRYTHYCNFLYLLSLLTRGYKAMTSLLTFLLGFWVKRTC